MITAPVQTHLPYNAAPTVALEYSSGNAEATNNSSSPQAARDSSSHTVASRERRAFSGQLRAGLMNAPDSSSSSRLEVPEGRAWNLLSGAQALNKTQREELNTYVNGHTGVDGQTLLDLLVASAGSTLNPQDGPGKQLRNLFESSAAQALGEQLASHFKGTINASAEDWVKIALINQLDRSAGTEHRKIAGYDVQQSSNQGKSYGEITRDFAAHLVTAGKANEQNSMAMAHLLLAGVAPELTLAGVPPTLQFGSIESVNLAAAVHYFANMLPRVLNNDEVLVEDAVNYFNTAKEEGHALSKKQSFMLAAMDWARLNGVVHNNPNYEYSEQEFATAGAEVARRIKIMSDAATTLNEPLKTRTELATEALEGIYSDEDDEPDLTSDILRRWPRGRYELTLITSLLDLYLSEKFDSFDEYHSMDTHKLKYLPFVPELKKLESPAALFEASYTKHLNSQRAAFTEIFKLELEGLPAQDKAILASADITVSGRTLERDPDSPHYKFLDAPLKVLIKAVTPAPDPKIYYYVRSHDVAGIRRADGIEKKMHLSLAFNYFNSHEWARWDASHASELDSDTSKVAKHRLDALAGTLSRYFRPDNQQVKAEAYGVTEAERKQAKNKAFHNFLLGFIPFYNSVKNFAAGNINDGFFYLGVDVLGIVAGAIKGGSLLAEVVTSSAVKTPFKVMKTVTT